MKVIALDTEVTIFNNGDPFDTRNKFVLGGFYDGTTYSIGAGSDFSQCFRTLGSDSKRFLLFNAKFDLHWLRNLGCVLDHLSSIWDCQLAEFILSNQQWRYPSLEEACIRRGLGYKIDEIKENYWKQGIDTDQIPTELLTTYLKQDLLLTYNLYLAQLKDFSLPENQGKYKLFRLQCQDLVVLQEMEYNGFKYDIEGSLNEAKRLEQTANQLDDDIRAFAPDVPLNLNSNIHLSCLLYGGQIDVDDRVPVGVYKTGTKVGQTRYKIVTKSYELPRLIEPLKGSELAKDGYFGSDEDTLRNLKVTGVNKRLIEKILERRGIEKLRGTYYEGIPKLMSEHAWADSLVHGQLNQCVTTTSRLSATKPNQQNMPPACKQFCVSRYP